MNVMEKNFTPSFLNHGVHVIFFIHRKTKAMLVMVTKICIAGPIPSKSWRLFLQENTLTMTYMEVENNNFHSFLARVRAYGTVMSVRPSVRKQDNSL